MVVWGDFCARACFSLSSLLWSTRQACARSLSHARLINQRQIRSRESRSKSASAPRLAAAYRRKGETPTSFRRAARKTLIFAFAHPLNNQRGLCVPAREVTRHSNTAQASVRNACTLAQPPARFPRTDGCEPCIWYLVLPKSETRQPPRVVKVSRRRRSLHFDL
jgi:hypothetical protein